jgi:hypothetical protein
LKPRSLYANYSFEDAVAKFRDFLSKNNYENNLVWVWPENVLFTDRWRCCVYVRDPLVTEARARALFEESRDAGRGLRLATVCTGDGATYAKMRSPADRDEALRTMVGDDLMMAAHTDRIQARRVRSSLRWRILGMVYGGRQELRTFLFE